MEGHDFQPWSEKSLEKTKYVRGLDIYQTAASSGTLKNYNFVDITLADLIVEVAGGVCNINLGESEIEVSVNRCSQETYGQQFKHYK